MTVPGAGLTAPPAHIGPAAPVCMVRVRTGRFVRGYLPWDQGQNPLTATIGTSDPTLPWQATWTALTPWVTVPNIIGVDLTQNYGQKGVRSAVIHVENIVYAALAAAGGGTYHQRKRGYLSPLRGFDSGRPPLVDEDGTPVTQNAWYEILKKDSQIDVWEGYGTEMARTFTGLIDDCDLTSHPDHLTITARDFGKPLTEEHLFGWNKDPRLPDPITFIDRSQAMNLHPSAYNSDTSSDVNDNHTGDMAIDGDSTTYWESDIHTIQDFTEWISFEVKEGTYQQYMLHPKWGSSDMYVSVKPTALANGQPPTRTVSGVTTTLTAGAWVDVGSGIVPGANGGVPWLVHDVNVTTVATKRWLDAAHASFTMGDGSTIRLSFRTSAQVGEPGDYGIGVTTVYGYRQQLLPEALAQNWILVDDISDVVKVILRWAGFKEWEVESAGATLPKRLIFNFNESYMDVIDRMIEGIGFVFYMKAPTTDDGSIGIPVWRYPRAVSLSQVPVAHIEDRMLLNAIDIKTTDEALATVIRVQGKGVTSGGVSLNGAAQRITYTFYPPWSSVGNGTPNRIAGIDKQVIRVDDLYTSLDDCRFAAYAIALREALASIQATIQFPGYPVFELDEQAELLDLGTGVSTRLAVDGVVSVFRAGDSVGGEAAIYAMTVTGPLLDTEDISQMVAIIQAAPARELPV